MSVRSTRSWRVALARKIAIAIRCLGSPGRSTSFASRSASRESTYEKAKRDGWGPREMVLGSTGIRLTDEARAEWIASREKKAAAVAAKRRERQSGPAVAEESTTSVKTPPRRRAAFRFSSDRAKRSAITDLERLCRSGELRCKRGDRLMKPSSASWRDVLPIHPAAQLLPLEGQAFGEGGASARGAARHSPLPAAERAVDCIRLRWAGGG